MNTTDPMRAALIRRLQFTSASAAAFLTPDDVKAIDDAVAALSTPPPDNATLNAIILEEWKGHTADDANSINDPTTLIPAIYCRAALRRLAAPAPSTVADDGADFLSQALNEGDGTYRP